ncbi:magnesium-dependent phosphatase 1 isoform X1 [Rhipicephalus sanguineus]|uniref:magnesium-dependent phosphatase 1 isoform X1 n=2 Tax=Rhipicephalus sanguineus TaxID=34632 RepID=UPI001893FACF|nr:magnesium-dependent phosphatase 1 isoform X1 [Rhipicephalus sanguineus]
MHSTRGSTSSANDKRPKLIVFDLDYTLWPMYVDTHVTPPFKKVNGKITDRHGRKVSPYPGVPAMLESLKSQKFQMGLASRTDDPDAAKELLVVLDWNKYFPYQEIYPGCKVTHFKKFAQQTGFSYEDMLFFDDEMRNITDVSKLGVTCVHVKDGMSQEVLDEGLRRFENET